MSVSFYPAGAEHNYANYSNATAVGVLEALGFLAEDGDFSDACIGECDATEFAQRVLAGITSGNASTLTALQFARLSRLSREAKASGVPILWG